MIHRNSAAVLLAIATLMSLAACSPANGGPTASSPPDANPLDNGHGAVSGAREMSEPQPHLVTVDERGALQMLDLLDESVEALGELHGVEAVTTEGRYLYAIRPGFGAVSIVDSGVWAWSHVDHFHYYRAEPAVLGDVAGAGRASVAANDFGVGILFAESGEAMVLSADALGRASVAPQLRFQVTPHDGLVVPIGERALVTEPGPDGSAALVRALDADGSPLATVACPDAAGTITTVVGVVIGCDDSAILATIDDGGVDLERIPYPTGSTAAPATRFDARKGRPTVAGIAGDSGIWLLDTRARTWTLLDTGEPIVHATAVDDGDEHVLALSADGSLLVLSGSTGKQVAETEPLVADSLASEAQPGITLIADQQRAYLNGPTEMRLFEIDFADGARISRTFTTLTDPRFIAETGR